MTVKKLKTPGPAVEGLITEDRDFMKALMRQALEEVLGAEMTEFLGAAQASGARGAAATA